MANQKTVRSILALAFVAAGTAFPQGYGGPSMLSRGGNRPGQRGRAPVNVNIYAAVRGSVETGLLPIALPDADTALPNARAYGLQMEAGVYGGHAWRRTMAGVDYRGDYRRYFTGTVSGVSSLQRLNGTNQALSADIQSQVTSRITVFGAQTAGTTNRAFGGFAGPSLPNNGNFAVPTDELFDTRVYYSQTSGGMVYRRTARTAFLASGDVFFVKRPVRSLVGTQGGRAAGGWQYQPSRRTTLYGGYQYLNFRYPRAFGGMDAHGFGGRIVRNLTRSLEVQGAAALFRVEVFGTQRVTLSPEVAAILGRSSGVEAFNRRSWARQLELTGTYRLERSSFSAGVASAVTPGNGVYLASTRDSAHVGYSYSGIRRLSIGASASYSRMSSLGLDLSGSEFIRAGLGANYNLGGGLNASMQFDRRSFNSPGLRGRDGYALLLGLTYSPARLPLPIW